MDRNYPGPCPECCDICFALLGDRPTLTLVLSGITFCGCLSSGLHFSELATGTINGSFILTKVPGLSEWTLDLPGHIIFTEYGISSCGGTPTSTTPLDYQLTIMCNSGILRIIAKAGSIFNGTTTSLITPVINTNTSPGICNSFGASAGYGGTATIS